MKASILSKLAVAVAALSLPLAALAAVCPGPDTFGHTCQDSPAGCVAITGTSANLAVGDDVCTSRPVGFTFNFYGTPVTTVGVASNGFLQMGGCGAGSGDFSNDCPVPTTFTPNNAIFGLWDDLNSGTGGSIRDVTTGVAPNRIYTVDYVNVPFFGSTATATFQIQVHENGGATNEAIIRILHGAVAQTDVTVGIENAAGTDGLSRFCNTATTNGLCHQYSRAAAPPGGGGCDLTPVLNALRVIEGKLDTNATRVTALTNSVAALTAAVNRLTGMSCDLIRLANTPHGQREACSPAVFASCGETYSWNSESTGGPQPDPPVCP